MNYMKFFPLPINASSQGHEIDMMIYLVHILMFVLLIGWGIFFVIALVKFNRRANPKANYQGVKSHVTSYIEVAVVVAEIILLVGFSIPFWAKQVNDPTDRKDAIEVYLVAEQFAWNFHYAGKDGKFGKTNLESFDKQSNPMGIDRKDPDGKDDITTINQLVLPIGRTAIIHVTSRDVIHSFGLPVMRVKQDAIPGLSIPARFTPTMTGDFEIACAQLCGIGHYRMKGFLKIKTQQEFDAWMTENTPTADGGDDFWN